MSLWPMQTSTRVPGHPLRQRLRPWILGLAFFCVAAGVGAPLDALSAEEEQAILERADSRWNGVLCRSRMPLKVKGKKADWVKCKRIRIGEEGLQDMVSVKVSDGAAVHRAFPGGTIPPGTQFRALGWSEEKNDVVLELEMVDIPVRARIFYYRWTGANLLVRVGAKHLADFEYWVRDELLEVVSAPTEELLEVPTAAAADQETAPALSIDETSTDSRSAAALSITVQAVAVQPPRVAPGGEVELMIAYDVGGVPPGPGFEVLEVREIQHQGTTIARFEEQLKRGNGHSTSYQPLKVPLDTPPGYYTLAARVVMAGREAVGTAIFEVAAP